MRGAIFVAAKNVDRKIHTHTTFTYWGWESHIDILIEMAFMMITNWVGMWT